MASEPEKRLGKYLLRARLGQGGMGVVYLATDLRLQRDVALKVLPEELAQDEAAVQRFLREARAAAKLQHPNVVAIHDVDRIGKTCFLVMELVRGSSAGDLLGQKKLPWQEATRIVAETCRGLAAAHAAGLIHRDIKPSNIMLGADGVVKLADFGLAKEVAGPGLTQSSLVIGTPDYMSPEQCQGDELDPRSDLYSLGATYFALLTGQPPFSGDQPMQTMFAHCSRPPPDPRTVDATVPAACARLVLRALAKPRGERFATAVEMSQALGELLASAQTLAPPIAAPPTESGAGAASGPAGAASLLIGPAPQGAGATLAVAATSVMPPTAAWSRTSGLGRGGVGFARRLWFAAGGLLLLLALGGWRLFFSGGSGSAPPPIGPTAGGVTAGGGASVPETPAHAPALARAFDLPPPASAVASVQFSEDSQRLWAATLGGAVQEWSLAERKVLREPAGAQGALRAVAAHREWVATGGDAKTVWLWRGDTAQPAHTLGDFSGEISALAFSPQGDRLAVGTYSEARLYALSAAGPQLLLELGTSGDAAANCYMVKSIVFSPNGRWLAATSWGEKGAMAWEADTGRLHAIYRGLCDDAIGLAFLPDSSGFVLGSIRSGAYRCNLTSKLAEQVPGTASATIRNLAIPVGGDRLLASGPWGGEIFCHDLVRGAKRWSAPGDSGASSLVLALAPSGALLASAGGDEGTAKGHIQLWRLLPEPAE